MTLTVTTPATDLNLLTLAELRAAVGISDSAQDAKLVILGKRVSASITAACRVAASGATPPTLRLETLSETFRYLTPRDSLILSRRPVISITTVTESDLVLAAENYWLDAAKLTRLNSNYPNWWASGAITVAYQAGWETVPDNLKLAAAKLAASYWTEDTREPGLRSFDVPGVYSASYQDKESDNPAVPHDVMQLLEAGGFVNYWV